MSWIYLSHILDEETPLYNDTGSVSIEKNKKILEGDSCNSSKLSFPAHSGTHMDAPYHFDEKGKTLDSYPPDQWFCSKPFFMEIPLNLGKLLGYETVKDNLKEVPKDCDILLIKTGAEKFRGDPSKDYSKKGIGITEELADWIRINLNIKFLAFDFISLSSPLERKEGRLAHKALLSYHETEKDPILILEDVSLKKLKSCPKQVVAVPLIFKESDGAMTTILAKI
jgi:kynurenine formamidase